MKSVDEDARLSMRIRNGALDSAVGRDALASPFLEVPLASPSAFRRCSICG